MEAKKPFIKTTNMQIYLTALNFVFTLMSVLALSYTVHILREDLESLRGTVSYLQQQFPDEHASTRGPRVVRNIPQGYNKHKVQREHPTNIKDSRRLNMLSARRAPGISAMVNFTSVTKVLPSPLTTKCKKIIKGKKGIICVIGNGKNITIDAGGRRITNGTIDFGTVTVDKGSNVLIAGRQVPLATRRYINAYVNQRVGKIFEGTKITDGTSLETFIDSKITQRLKQGVVATGGATAGKTQIIAIAGAPGPRGPKGPRGYRGSRGRSGPRGKPGLSAVMMQDGSWRVIAEGSQFVGRAEVKGSGGIGGGGLGGRGSSRGANVSSSASFEIGSILRGRSRMSGAADSLQGFAAPNISTRPPARNLIPAGDPIIVTAGAGGFPRPETYWVKEGARTAIYGDKLILDAAKTEDSGTWTFTAKNVMGTATAKMDLIVFTSPKITKKPPNKVTVYRGTTTLVECLAEGHPEPKVVWKRQGGKRLAKGRVKALQGNLYFNHPNQADAGMYICTATTAGGAEPAAAATLVSVERFSPVKFVKLAPGVIRVKDVTKRIVLNCTAKGNPPPTLTWYKDGVAMPTKILKDEDELTAVVTIKHVRSADQGTYRCAAKTRFLDKPIGYNTVISLYKCKAPHPPDNGVLVGRDYHVGSAVKYSCNPGCMLYGSAIRVCNKHGKWTGTQPICYDVGEVAYECHHYNLLDTYDRNANSRRMLGQCDNKLAEGWFRVSGDAGSKLPTTCQAPNACNAKFPGWLYGQHPRKEDGCILSHVCFGDYKNGCCSYKKPVLVRNCGRFYVYKLTPTDSCNMRYCTK